MDDPSRLKIILACLNDPISVGDIAPQLDLSPSLVSHHLWLLRVMHGCALFCETGNGRFRFNHLI